MQISDQWFMDMPQQFLGKPKIEVLIEAFSRQLQEIWQVFDDLNTRTDLETASGKTLDYVGTIVPLSRKEAGEMAEIGIAEPVISDERYRRFMNYKILRNTSECTYYDLVAGIELLWKYENIHYIEDPKHPAMIIFETPPLSLDMEDPVEFHASLCIRASGVGVILRKRYGDLINVPIYYTNAIHFRMSFYPQFNLKQLHLNRTWKLDGKQKLSGYDGFGRIDLYPVRIKIQTKAGETPKAKTQVVFLSKAKEEIKNSQNIEVKTSAEVKRKVSERITMPALTTVCTKTKTQAVFLLKTKEQIECNQNVKIRTSVICQKRTGERVTIQASAAVSAGTNEILMNNRNVLNGKWKLNGVRTLNGGRYQL